MKTHNINHTLKKSVMTYNLAFKFSIVTKPTVWITAAEVGQELAALSLAYLDVQEQLQRNIS